MKEVWMERKRIDEHKKRKPSGAAVIQASLTEALYRALFQEWALCGYNGIRLERVAARAGAGKAAIYRRWATKQAFASEAINQTGILLATVEDCGSLQKDIFAFLVKLRVTLRHPLVRKILPDIHAESARNGELAAQLNELASTRRKLGAAIFERAIMRGELSDTTDINFALDLLPSTLYWQMVILRKHISSRELKVQADVIFNAIRQPSKNSDRGSHYR
jgi:AcrR family transcriptional regulator